MGALGAAAQLFQGIEGFKAAKEESSAQRRQGGLAIAESEREAERTEIEGERIATKQKLGFLKSGVSLAGTPLDVIAETGRETERQAAAIRERGIAQGGLFRSRAKITRRQGRAALLGGVAKSALTFEAAQERDQNQ